MYPLPQFLQKIPKKKHRAPKLDLTFIRKHCNEEIPVFYALRQQQSTQHGFPIKTVKVDLDHNTKEVVDTNFKEEMCSCQHFLPDSEFEKLRDKVFHYAIGNVNATIVVDEKLDQFFISKV